MTCKPSCLVIGLGHIGYWHAHNFADNGYDVFYLDPYINTNEFIKIDNLESYGGDLILVATTSKNRFNIIQEIENHKKACCVILEKPLFNHRKQYKDFIQSKLHNTYLINLSFEPNVLNMLRREKSLVPMKIKASGNNWGMGCNILHDISFLGAYQIELGSIQCFSHRRLELIESKRKGFMEVTGELDFKIDDTLFEFRCGGRKNKKKVIDISFDDADYSINLYDEIISRKTNRDQQSWNFDAPKASLSSCYMYENKLLPLAKKYTKISLEIYSKISDALNLNGHFPFT